MSANVAFILKRIKQHISHGKSLVEKKNADKLMWLKMKVIIKKNTYFSRKRIRENSVSEI